MRGQFKDLPARLAVAFFSIAALALAIWSIPLGHWHIGCVVMGVVALALWEYAQIVKISWPLPTLLGVLWVAGVGVGIPVPHLLGSALFACSLYFLWKGITPFRSFFGVLYVAAPLGGILWLAYPERLSFDPRWVITFLFVVVKGTDSIALLVGRAFGKRKLAPQISPGKTWEGAIGGTLGGMVLGKCVALYAHLPFGLWIAALLSIAGQLGDLVESRLKRWANVKDSNRLPGLGGMLDMCDSLLFAIPVLVGWMTLFGTLHIEEKPMIVTIDGTAGTGKSTVAKGLAKRIGFTYFDTGAMYRALTHHTLEQEVDPTDEEGIAALLADFRFNIEADGHERRYYVGDQEVTAQIRTPEVTQHVSTVAKHPKVRQHLVTIQRGFGTTKDAVFEGRDIGTVVFPKAEFKVFLTASPRVRAERRLKEWREKHPEKADELKLEQVQQEIERRDHEDSTRAVSPLKQADDAALIDTSELSIEGVIEAILEAHPNLNQKAHS